MKKLKSFILFEIAQHKSIRPYTRNGIRKVDIKN